VGEELMSVGQGFGQHLHEYIQNYVKSFITVEPSLYDFFQTNGLIRQLPLGQDKLRYFTEEKPDGGQMSTSIHNTNVITPEYKEATVGQLYIAGKARISLQEALKFKSNQHIGGDLMKRTITSALRVIKDQVDQFLAYGDDMKNPVSAIDPFKGRGEFLGIFNGGTELAGGEGGDNDMQAENDYLSTVHKMRKAMLTAGHKIPKYQLFSDLDTEYYATEGSNFYSNVGISEYKRVMDLPYIQDWMVSPNFIDYAQTAYRMVMVCPAQRTGKGAGDIRPNLELIQSMPFYVHPEHGGGTNDGYYEYLLIWCGALLIYHDTAVQRTPTLTLTS
jgi:hypothetical protein